MFKKICDCPYYKSCHETRQELQVEHREENEEDIRSCPFYPYLKEMYEKLEVII